MAAPVDSARVATNISTAATSHAINVGSPVAGTLLIVFIRFAAAPGVVSFPGYILLVSDSSDASDDTTNIYYRPADGTEGASDTLTTVNSVKLGAISWEVTGAETIQAPSISTVNVGTTAANTCQSNSVAPTNAPQDTLYITMGGEDGEVGAFTAAPTNYVNLQAANSGTGGAAATNVLMGGASRQISASSSDDAGVFTHAAASNGWTAFAIAIRPPIGTPTQLFLQDTVPDTHLGTDNANLVGANVGWTSRALATTRGPGVVASDAVATVAGPTAGLEVTKTDRVEWLTPPVAADVTISGTILANIWASEAAATGNVAINVVIEVVRASDLTGLDSSNALVSIATTTNTNEVALTTRNDNLLSVVPGASVAVNRGDRLRVRVFGDDAGTMGAATTFNASWAGTTARADGDTFVTFSEAITFESAPSGTQLFLTNVQSGVISGAPTLISAFAGADENPLSEGGNWAAISSSGTTANQLKIVSNAVTGATAATTCWSYWTPANFGPDCEAYVTLTNASDVVGIAMRIQQEGGASTFDGYRVTRSGATTSAISRIDNATVVNLLTGIASGTWAAGDKLGMRIVGTQISVWRQASGSSVWTFLGSTTDATYASAGKIALVVNSTTASLDDFYAGTSTNVFSSRQAWTSRGSGVVSDTTNTVAGWTAPIQDTDVAAGGVVDWYTKQLTAFTLTGMAQANIRALESNASANASLRCEIARVESDGTSPTVWASWCIAPTSTDNGELTTSEVARTANVSGDDLTISDGQRLRIRIYEDDMSSAAMGATVTTQVFYNGTSAAASGDTYLTLAQTITEFSAGGVDDKLMAVLQAVNRSSIW